MIMQTQGNILTADAEALVNTVNCVGVMGKGIALQFKKAFPENFKAYEAACRRKEVRPGRMFVFETGQMINADSERCSIPGAFQRKPEDTDTDGHSEQD